MCIFEYEVNYFKDLEKETTYDCGYVVGPDLATAVDNITYYIGEVNIVNIILRPVSDKEMYSLNSKEDKYDIHFKLMNTKNKNLKN